MLFACDLCLILFFFLSFPGCLISQQWTNLQRKDVVNYWSKGSSLEWVQRTFWKGNPLKLTHILRKLRLYLNIQTKGKKENFSPTRKHKKQQNNKKAKVYLQEHDLYIQEKTKLSSLSLGQYYFANFLLHIVRMLKIYTFIAHYSLLNIVHKNKKKKVLFKLYLSPIK